MVEIGDDELNKAPTQGARAWHCLFVRLRLPAWSHPLMCEEPPPASLLSSRADIFDLKLDIFDLGVSTNHLDIPLTLLIKVALV